MQTEKKERQKKEKIRNRKKGSSQRTQYFLWVEVPAFGERV